MTVAELIEKLKQMPQEALVITEGYEDGYDTIKKVSIISIEENPKSEWYLGKYIGSTKPDSQKSVFLNAETKADNK
ncbi:MAG: hypothetical protein K0M40_14315 [Prolixibacteraceae bacterium]|nr:hypothetical protein [Prolixibacteraceae bacterium]